MKNIIITGAAGFIGRYLVERYLESGHHIYAIIRPGTRNRLPKSGKLTAIELEMKNYQDMSKYISETCDVFYSLAWAGVRGDERNDYLLQEKNYNFTMESIRQAVRLGCKKIILAGSQAEYGCSESVICEDMPSFPLDEYGKWKYKLYISALEYCKQQKIHLLETRIFSLYGKGDSSNTLISILINNLLNNETCYLSACTHYWNYLHVIDAADALFRLGEYECADGIYNLASDDTRIMREFVEEMKEITQSNSELIYDMDMEKRKKLVNLIPDITKISQELNWRPSISFEKGIRDLLGER